MELVALIGNRPGGENSEVKSFGSKVGHRADNPVPQNEQLLQKEQQRNISGCEGHPDTGMNDSGDS